MQEVRKAVIAAAGFGTRFLPQTKAMPKEMLPIIDKPVIQLVVEGAVSAGVEDIIIVTGPTKRAIEDHFDRALELEDELREKGKNEQADKLKAIAELANFVYIRQKGAVRGNAVPILNSQHLLENSPFFYFFADDFFTGEVSCAQQLLKVYQTTGKSVIALREVDPALTKSYGIVQTGEEVSPGVFRITDVIEKPEPAAAPSHLAVGSGYLLTPEILPIISAQQPGAGGELQVADAVAELAKKDEVYGCVIQGDYHDTGSPEVYLETIVRIVLKDPKMGPRFKEYLRSLL